MLTLNNVTSVSPIVTRIIPMDVKPGPRSVQTPLFHWAVIQLSSFQVKEDIILGLDIF